MSITSERKQALIVEYATKKDDTGSPEVQVAIDATCHPLMTRSAQPGTPEKSIFS